MMVWEAAKAKINLDLRICGRRDDGYHDLDSLVVFADLGDELVLQPSDRLMLEIEGPFANDLDHHQDNLVCRAVLKLAKSLGRQPDVAITLTKNLPVSSGIGGGSADAAATLRGLARLWGLPMTVGDLMPIGRELGADVAVCLTSCPVRMTGIGDCLAPLDLHEPLWILLANPGTPLPTSNVFNALNDISGERPDEWPLGQAMSFDEALRSSVNDLQAPAIGIAPGIQHVLKAISEEVNCQLARMSGSGATCFGLFRDSDTLTRAASSLRGQHPDWWIAASVCR